MRNLQQDPSTGVMVAYPLRMEGERPKRKRGRPRKVRPDPLSTEELAAESEQKQRDEEEREKREAEEKAQEEEEEEQAAQGLLELQQSSGLIVKRSSRKRKPVKKLMGIEYFVHADAVLVCNGMANICPVVTVVTLNKFCTVSRHTFIMKFKRDNFN